MPEQTLTLVLPQDVYLKIVAEAGVRKKSVEDLFVMFVADLIEIDSDFLVAGTFETANDILKQSKGWKRREP